MDSKSSPSTPLYQNKTSPDKVKAQTRVKTKFLLSIYGDRKCITVSALFYPMQTIGCWQFNPPLCLQTTLTLLRPYRVKRLTILEISFRPKHLLKISFENNKIQQTSRISDSHTLDLHVSRTKSPIPINSTSIIIYVPYLGLSPKHLV